MAVIKHIASKNSDYGESERYLIFQHNEYTQKPILDEEGHMILREEYYLDGLNCDPSKRLLYISDKNLYLAGLHQQYLSASELLQQFFRLP